MRLWRLAREPHTALNGLGGLYASGRWHNQGRPVIYAAESVPGAAMEVLAHLEIDPEDMPDFRLLGIEIPDAIPRTDAAPPPSGWQTDQTATRASGDAWLDGGNGLLLRVPSALADHTSNWLINPRHADMARVVLTINQPFVWDKRLL